MDSGILYLWFAYPDDLLDEQAFARSLDLLSEDEHEKLQRFKFEASRREYLAAHTLARTALSHCDPIPPEAWHFRTNSYGKPFLDPPSDLFFSLSRRRGLVACLVARGAEVGVDVESHERAGEVLEIAPRVFSVQERAQLSSMTGSDKLDRALSLWTLKEAYAKARGMGLSLPLQEFSFIHCPPRGMALEDNTSIGANTERWRFCTLDHVGHRIALMAEFQRQPHLEVRAMRPFQVPSLLPHDPQPVWFPQESA